MPYKRFKRKSHKNPFLRGITKKSYLKNRKKNFNALTNIIDDKAKIKIKLNLNNLKVYNENMKNKEIKLDINNNNSNKNKHDIILTDDTTQINSSSENRQSKPNETYKTDVNEKIFQRENRFNDKRKKENQIRDEYGNSFKKLKLIEYENERFSENTSIINNNSSKLILKIKNNINLNQNSNQHINRENESLVKNTNLFSKSNENLLKKGLYLMFRLL